MRDGPAGKFIHLQGADDALGIVDVQAVVGLRIHSLQIGIDRLASLFAYSLPPLFFDLRVRDLGCKQSADQRLEIKARAADHPHTTPAAQKVRDAATGLASELAGAVGLIRIADVDKMVGNPAAFLRGGLGGADVHKAVNLARISGHDIGGEPARQLEGQLGLADRRGTDQEINPRRAQNVCPILRWKG
ncbi:MAG: hypothetical protein BWY83_01956 [bacterium ADurb.Bin478]|nr:MAG: hypothetical protein BWY83_01956 [bacterium ADurb.Bin478]